MHLSTLLAAMTTCKSCGYSQGCGKVLVYNNIFEHGEYREQ
jgi:hypothetical protein